MPGKKKSRKNAPKRKSAVKARAKLAKSKAKNKAKRPASASPVVYVLKITDPDLRTKGGFQYPSKGVIKAPNFLDNGKCGDGLHGYLNGAGDVQSSNRAIKRHGFNACKGLVLAVKARDVHEVEGGSKVKFPAGRVVFVGSIPEAAAFIAKRSPGATLVNGAIVETSAKHSAAHVGGLGLARAMGPAMLATAGARGKAECEHGVAVAGKNGEACTIDGTAIVRRAGTAKAESGMAISRARKGGKAMAGQTGRAIVGNDGEATAGPEGVAIGFLRSKVSVGPKGIAFVGREGMARGGMGATLHFRFRESAASPTRTILATVDGSRILADVWYRISSYGVPTRA